uniref:Uncharacterized protein n=1 Tax=Rhodopseudomonas palustris (strain DX-1) TaxID=652103 RepID=E6VL63_RHOPX
MKFKTNAYGSVSLEFKDADGDVLKVHAPANGSESYYLGVNEVQVRMPPEKAVKLAKKILKREGLW